MTHFQKLILIFFKNRCMYMLRKLKVYRKLSNEKKMRQAIPIFLGLLPTKTSAYTFTFEVETSTQWIIEDGYKYQHIYINLYMYFFFNSLKETLEWSMSNLFTINLSWSPFHISIYRITLYFLMA